MRLTGKSHAELSELLAGKSFDDLVAIIHRLTTFEQLLSPAQIAAMSGIRKRDVIEEMKAGKFVDPLFGPGFFRRGNSSLKVSASAVAAWRRGFWVAFRPVPGIKKNAAAQNHLGAPRAAQKVIRDASPGYLAAAGRSEALT